MAESKKIAPQSIYTPELAKLICRRIATNPIGTATLCKMFDDMPAQVTIYEWRYDHPEFDAMYLEAKDKQALLMAESLDDIAHEKGELIIDEKGNKRLDPAFINDKRLRIDTRKWIAARLQPKRYGDRRPSEEQQNPQETLSKIQALVADLNKTNVSDI